MMSERFPYVKISHPNFFLIVHAQPGARKSGWGGTHGDRLKIKLKAPPVDGQANEELLRFLRAEFKVVESVKLSLVQGERSREKRVCVESIWSAKWEEFFRRLHPNSRD